MAVAATGLLPVNETTYPTLVGNHRGQVVLVDFWATWCEPCRTEMPALAALRKKIGFVLLTVSADEPEQASAALRFLTQSRISLPGWIKRARNDQAFIDLVDPKWSGALPGLFLYDRTGKLQRSFIGETDLVELESEIRKL